MEGRLSSRKGWAWAWARKGSRERVSVFTSLQFLLFVYWKTYRCSFSWSFSGDRLGLTSNASRLFLRPTVVLVSDFFPIALLSLIFLRSPVALFPNRLQLSADLMVLLTLLGFEDGQKKAVRFARSFLPPNLHLLLHQCSLPFLPFSPRIFWSLSSSS